jgi:glutamate N-acetyltransferase/amino-acid N-acetyltransferase
VSTPTQSPLAPEEPFEVPPVSGVRGASLALGLRYRGRDDVALIALPPASAVAGLLTRSTTPGHPVRWCRRILPGGRLRAVVINAGNANVFNGAAGDAAVATEVDAVARTLDCPREEVFVASTGVIGEPLDAKAIAAAVPSLVDRLSPEGLADCARAILTTDTFPKAASAVATIAGVEVRLTGIAKGSGMIAPDMATMLAFVATDADLEPAVLQPLLARAADRSFHCTTVDGDSSTSDMVLLMASRRARHVPVADVDDPHLAEFARALDDVCRRLAQLVVRDGEGARKFVEIAVTGAADDPSARRAGLAVANSPLVKTAIAGGDANWGRVVMALGKSGEPLEPDRLAVRFGDTLISAGGGVVDGYDERTVAAHLAGREVRLHVDLGVGDGRACVWTCDLTHGYIDINADYRS